MLACRPSCGNCSARLLTPARPLPPSTLFVIRAGRSPIDSTGTEEYVVVLKGKLNIAINGALYTLEEGDILFFEVAHEFPTVALRLKFLWQSGECARPCRNSRCAAGGVFLY